jgi:Phosphotransferase enzyme family
MGKRSMVAVIETGLTEHPAVRAWECLGLHTCQPNRIQVLQFDKKTQAFLLEGVGSDRSNVIAKRSTRGRGMLEHRIYSDALAHLPITGIRYYGSLADQDSDFLWLFMEQATGEFFSPLEEEHRKLAARWIGALHSSAAELLCAADLPARGPDHFLEELRVARNTILQNLTNKLLTSANLTVLALVVDQLDLVEKHWIELQNFADRMPRTLVHGDLVGKNVRVRTGPSGKHLIVIDWETGGWGMPAVDLSQLGGNTSISPDLDTYRSVIQIKWPQLSQHDVSQLGLFGGLFRLINAIRWATKSLPTHWVEDSIEELERYTTKLAALIFSLGWE